MNWMRSLGLLLLPILAFSQALTPEAREAAERAHRVLEQDTPAPSEVAETVTRQATALLPGESATTPIERRNFIDEHIFGRMERDGIPHAGLSSDREFARRAYLDAIGRIPSIEELSSFVADNNPAKRDELIEALISSDEFISYWSYYFEDIMRAGNRMGFGKNLFHYWTEEWLRLDRSYAEVVTDLLTQGGKSSHSSPGALYFARDFVKALDDPEKPDAHDLVNRADAIDEFTITYGKTLLGMNMGCISCHDGAGHLEKVSVYFTGKTREDFFRQAAFFGRTRMIMNWENGFQANTEYTVDDVEPGYPTTGESIVRVPRTGGKNEPKFILTDERANPDAMPRDELARLLTGHIQFSRAFTNRIWSKLMGFGIVEPIDGFDLALYYEKDVPEGWTQQPSNPQLLDAMARDFQQSDFSFRHVMRTIMRSSAYQLSSRFDGDWQPEYTKYYARHFVTMMSPIQLHDAIATATAVPGSFNSKGYKANLARDLIDPAYTQREVNEFLRAFGQQTRDEFPAKTPASALQAMLLMNSQVVLDRVQAEGESRVEQLLDRAAEDRLLIRQTWRAANGTEPSDADVERTLDRGLVEKLYAATLSRPPTASEADVAQTALARERRKGLENLQWALLNKPEFLFKY